MVEDTRNAAAVAKFELLFHGIGSITSLLDLLVSNEPMKHTECNIQHALSKSRRHLFNQNVDRVLDFVQAQQNPYSICTNVQISIPLHNILTKEAVDLNVAASLLNCFGSRENAYHS